MLYNESSKPYVNCELFSLLPIVSNLMNHKTVKKIAAGNRGNFLIESSIECWCWTWEAKYFQSLHHYNRRKQTEVLTVKNRCAIIERSDCFTRLVNFFHSRNWKRENAKKTVSAFEIVCDLENWHWRSIELESWCVDLKSVKIMLPINLFPPSRSHLFRFSPLPALSAINIYKHFSFLFCELQWNGRSVMEEDSSWKKLSSPRFWRFHCEKLHFCNQVS